MRIRQLVRKVNKSLGENPQEWTQYNHARIPCVVNSRGLRVCDYFIAVSDRWNDTTQFFELNNKEIDYLAQNFYTVAKPISVTKIDQVNKRRGWLIKEVLKTI